MHSMRKYGRWRVRLVGCGEVEDEMKRADATLQEKRDLVGAWQGTETSGEPPVEWDRAQEVRNRPLSDGKRVWQIAPRGKGL